MASLPGFVPVFRILFSRRWDNLWIRVRTVNKSKPAYFLPDLYAPSSHFVRPGIIPRTRVQPPEFLRGLFKHYVALNLVFWISLCHNFNKYKIIKTLVAVVKNLFSKSVTDVVTGPLRWVTTKTALSRCIFLCVNVNRISRLGSTLRPVDRLIFLVGLSFTDFNF